MTLCQAQVASSSTLSSKSQSPESSMWLSPLELVETTLLEGTLWSPSLASPLSPARAGATQEPQAGVGAQVKRVAGMEVMETQRAMEVGKNCQLFVEMLKLKPPTLEIMTVMELGEVESRLMERSLLTRTEGMDMGMEQVGEKTTMMELMEWWSSCFAMGMNLGFLCKCKKVTW